jgi:hypothetical protein
MSPANSNAEIAVRDFARRVAQELGSVPNGALAQCAVERETSITLSAPTFRRPKAPVLYITPPLSRLFLPS